MRKRLLRTFSVLLCLAMLCSVSAYAAEARTSDQIFTCTASLSKQSSGDLKITYLIKTIEVMDHIGASSIVLERYNGTQWVIERTYYFASMSTLQTSGASLYSSTLAMAPKYDGTNYRAKVTFYAKNSSGSSTRLVVTNTITT